MVMMMITMKKIEKAEANKVMRMMKMEMPIKKKTKTE